MKGQILRRCPEAQLVDLTHEISPQDVRAASFHLEQSTGYFPPGTVHLAVVDPGVGTGRRMVAVRTETAIFVAPDNGLLTRALREVEILESVELVAPRSASSTFHGRDVMAPAAAELAKGRPLWELGPNLEVPLAWLEFEPPELSFDKVQASVLSIDHFGNVAFDLGQMAGVDIFDLGSRWTIRGRELGVSRTYGEVEEGASVLLWSSQRLLELAVRNGRADTEWGLATDARVEFLRL